MNGRRLLPCVSETTETVSLLSNFDLVEVQPQNGLQKRCTSSYLPPPLVVGGWYFPPLGEARKKACKTFREAPTQLDPPTEFWSSPFDLPKSQYLKQPMPRVSCWLTRIHQNSFKIPANRQTSLGHHVRGPQVMCRSVRACLGGGGVNAALSQTFMLNHGGKGHTALSFPVLFLPGPRRQGPAPTAASSPTPSTGASSAAATPSSRGPAWSAVLGRPPPARETPSLLKKILITRFGKLRALGSRPLLTVIYESVAQIRHVWLCPYPAAPTPRWGSSRPFNLDPGCAKVAPTVESG